ncbi:MAG: hypothetical protein FJY56_11700 [Betaproteobacteria bacterium]|nr:hypothetical protein [Betaproteobacteria bacterium]
MRSWIWRSLGAALVTLYVYVFAGAIAAFAAQPPTPDIPAQAPRDARSKVDRDDLSAPLHDSGEVRVIVELRAPAGITPNANAA